MSLRHYWIFIYGRFQVLPTISHQQPQFLMGKWELNIPFSNLTYCVQNVQYIATNENLPIERLRHSRRDIHFHLQHGLDILLL